MIHTDSGWEQEDATRTFAPRTSTGPAPAGKHGGRRRDEVKDDPSDRITGRHGLDVDEMSEAGGGKRS
jgi:hypothetical protein